MSYLGLERESFSSMALRWLKGLLIIILVIGLWDYAVKVAIERKDYLNQAKSKIIIYNKDMTVMKEVIVTRLEYSIDYNTLKINNETYSGIPYKIIELPREADK